MPAVMISDADESGDFLAFDLADILETLAPWIGISEWRCVGVECLGPGADAMHAVDDNRRRVSSDELFQLARNVSQTIGGYFYAYEPANPHPWLAIRAVDGVGFDVECVELVVIEALRQRFHSVRDFPPDGGSYLNDG
jgi:hypothetical protein